MNRWFSCLNGLSVGVALFLAGTAMTSPRPALAQETSSSAGPRAGMRLVSDLAARLSRAGGVAVVADASVKDLRAPLPAEATTAANVEQQIADLVAALPQGATWAKLFLPAPPAGRSYNGDDVAAYAGAQVKLFGPVGAATTDVVEVMGQKIPAGDASTVVAALKLRPVYLITNPLNGAASRWAAMTAEQQQAYAQQQAAQLASGDPAARRQWMQEHRMVFTQLMRTLSPDQREALLKDSGVRVMIRDGSGNTINAGSGGPAVILPGAP